MPAGGPHKLWSNIEESATRQVTTTRAPVLLDMFLRKLLTFLTVPLSYNNETLKTSTKLGVLERCLREG